MRRLCDTFQTVSQLPLASPSFTHRLDPHWPLCTYDIRGSCRDAKCQYQHASDYQLENVAVLRDLHSQAVRLVSNPATVMHAGCRLCMSSACLPRYRYCQGFSGSCLSLMAHWLHCEDTFGWQVVTGIMPKTASDYAFSRAAKVYRWI